MVQSFWPVDASMIPFRCDKEKNLDSTFKISFPVSAFVSVKLQSHGSLSMRRVVGLEETSCGKMAMPGNGTAKRVPTLLLPGRKSLDLERPLPSPAVSGEFEFSAIVIDVVESFG